MKKVLLFSILFFITILAVQAYETVIIKFPAGEKWEKVYYKKFGIESILQYAPSGEHHKNWSRSIIIHAYPDSAHIVNNFMSNNLAKMFKNNPTGGYKYLKQTPTDSIAVRCTDDYKNIKTQCEIYRVTRAHDGVITIHYVNRNKDDFIKNAKQWYEIIKRAKFLNTYWRNERTLNKSEYFEIW